MNIHDLSEYQLYKLKSIDPALSSNWYEIIHQILPQLNEEGQISIYKNILMPRGIGKDLVYRRPDSLKIIMKSLSTQNNNLISIASHMSKMINSRPKDCNAMKLADEIEAVLDYLDNLDIHDLIYDQKNRQKIRTAFLYDLAEWIDIVNLDVDAGLRELDIAIVKSYLKEVFIKQKIQDRDFRSWDSSDLSFQELAHLPSFIKEAGKHRKFFVVEGEKHWFLIGRANKTNKNPYSFRRFLHEDSSGSDNRKYIYLTHIVLEKDNMHDPQYIAHASHCMSRLYTLDRGVSDTVIKFVNEIQQLNKEYLIPLLKKPLEQHGSNSEVIIEECMIKYEKQLSILILNKLPKIIQTVMHDINDQDYLFYNLDQLLKRMIENIQDFRLQPLSMYSVSSEVMAIKLITLRTLLTKLHHTFSFPEKNLIEHLETMEIPLTIIKEKLDETEVSIRELQYLKFELDNYYKTKEEGSFWQKIKLGKMPDYTLEEIFEIKATLQEELFMSIVRLAKTENNGMVYPEFECNIIINENYRHYAIADGKLGISRLPRIVRLPEDKSKFNIESVRKTVDYDIFKSTQEWHNIDG
ncbi:hypothetical protein [Psychrobacter frigidicola]|uniref:hypothetical protein n=1 Tax=Psychrobacter frigidicola TaxID=45611 RepID=UPI00191A690B|nr:hypothetical protein [Psychrobacter frigidicola]